MLGRVGIPSPRRRMDDYPHQFSGGMRQRVMIAMALVNDPKLLIADEPTTALDVTVQAQILDLIQDLQRDFGSAVLFITHDLGVVAEIADDILVMYGGRCVEYGSVNAILGSPNHPYTWGLLGSIPPVSGEPARLLPDPGRAAEPARAAHRVPVPPALRLRRAAAARRLPRRAARAHPPDGRPGPAVAVSPRRARPHLRGRDPAAAAVRDRR